MKCFRADYFFDGSFFRDQGELLLTDDDGRVLDWVREVPEIEVRHIQGLAMPAWINAHTHLELAHLHGKIPMHTGLPAFLGAVTELRGKFTVDSIEAAMQKAEKDMIRSGTAAVGDICNTNMSLRVKSSHQLPYHNFIECIGLDTTETTNRLNTCLTLLHTFQPYRASLVPHAPYSVSSPLLQEISRFSKDQIISIHHQESQAESVWFQEGGGEFRTLFNKLLPHIHPESPFSGSSTAFILPFFQQAKRVILVHNTFTTGSDLAFIKQCDAPVSLCLCPRANQFIENKLPDIPLFVREGMHLIIGTDSLASNHSLHVGDEIRVIHEAFPEISWNEKLRWLTSHGAEALGFDSLGSLQKGKQPGLIQIESFDIINGWEENARVQWILPANLAG